jgi:integrase
MSVLSLRDLRAEYLIDHAIGSGAGEQLHFMLVSLERFLGRAADIPDFNDGLANRWIMWLAREGYAIETIRSRRRMLLTLWRYAADEGLCQLPRKVRRVVGQSLPIAWREDDLPLIVRECRKLRGTFKPSGVVRKLFAEAFANAAYESGFRCGDVLRIRRPQITDSGRIVIVQSKTGIPHVGRIRRETMALIDAMGTAGRETVFDGLISRRGLSQMFRRIIDRAGLEKGSIKWFRRSGATHVEKRQRGTAFLYLGHTTPRVAYTSYVDRSQLEDTTPMPPRIG